MCNRTLSSEGFSEELCHWAMPQHRGIPAAEALSLLDKKALPAIGKLPDPNSATHPSV